MSHCCFSLRVLKITVIISISYFQDLKGVVSQINIHLGCPYPRGLVDKIVEASSFTEMRRRNEAADFDAQKKLRGSKKLSKMFGTSPYLRKSKHKKTWPEGHFSTKLVKGSWPDFGPDLEQYSWMSWIYAAVLILDSNVHIKSVHNSNMI